MPSQRRVKVFGLMVLLTILITLYMTSSARSTQNSEFYTKTSDALAAKEAAAQAEKINADDVGARLKAAEEAAKKAADVKGHKLQEAFEAEEEPGEKSVAGRVLMKEPEEKEERVVDLPNTEEKVQKPVAAKQEPETKEDHEVEVELNAILKKSPSKSSRCLLCCVLGRNGVI
jgi:hypothetical protein